MESSHSMASAGARSTSLISHILTMMTPTPQLTNPCNRVTVVANKTLLKVHTINLQGGWISKQLPVQGTFGITCPWLRAPGF
jgi:hypothetical protein